MNQNDTLLLTESFFALLETADLLELDLAGSYLTLDAGFDSAYNRQMIHAQGLFPVIRPNPRNTKDPEKLIASESAFVFHEHIYKQRCTIERCFAWEDVYRKLVTRYEKLRCAHLGFKYLAYSMINLRWFIGKNRSYSL